ncbi:MAG: FAD:protein FMN transferase [Actinomycetota bacterium]|nr:MAG: FAD:protein FMN transferase [Actinomycetota bacterium]
MIGPDGYRTSALGTQCSLVAYDDPPSSDAISVFLELIAQMDLAASRFREDSEINRVFNGQAHKRVAVSPLLFDALAAALYGAEMTSGYLDPTVAGSMAALGYRADFVKTLASGALGLDELRIVIPPGYRSVRLNKTNRTVTVAQGVTFDLGSTGKAFLADRIRETIELKLSEPVLVNLGGDISASRIGDGRFWPVKVTDDRGLDPSSVGITIAVFGGGVATSSTLHRAWKNGDKDLHHIVDPFSGLSADSMFDSVTVLAGSALDANIASSGTIAMGPKGPGWLASTGLPAFARNADSQRRYFGHFEQVIVERELS